MEIKNYGKIALETVVTSIVAALILYIVMYVIGIISPMAGAWQTFLTALVAAGFIVLAVKIHPGEENFIETIPIVIVAMAIVGLIQSVIPMMPGFDVEFTWVGLAWGLSAVFLSHTLVKQFLK
jgi:hypothetical protein